MTIANADDCLIWSNEHSGWWKPGESGYTKDIRLAGIYTRDRAVEISSRALIGSRNGVPNELPVRFLDTVLMEVKSDGEGFAGTYTCTICGKQHAKLTECDTVPFERLPEPQQAIITRLARAICAADHCDPDEPAGLNLRYPAWQRFIRHARAALPLLDAALASPR